VFRFTIRNLFWLTLLAAVVVAWAVDHKRQNAQIQKLKDKVLHPWSGLTLDVF
jgi:hypothetical protein